MATADQPPPTRQRAPLGFWLSAAGVVLLLAFVGYALLRAMDREATGFAVRAALQTVSVSRRPAPDFTLSLFAGGLLRLQDLRDRPVLLYFWASWCASCRREQPTLERVWRAYQSTDFLLVGINIQDREADARAYLQKFGVTYPNGPDRRGTISIDYGVTGVPEKYFIDRQGQIVRKFIGPVPEDVLVAAIEDLIGPGPSETETPPAPGTT